MIPVRSGRGDRRIYSYGLPVRHQNTMPPTGRSTGGLKVKAAFLKRKKRKPKQKGKS